MILLSLDFETTGLDRDKDRITEVGYVLWSTGHMRMLQCESFFVKSDVPVPEEVTKKTGVTNKMLDRFGYTEIEAIDTIIEQMGNATAMIGQNIVQFDKPFLENAAKRAARDLPVLPWIDTRTDLPATVETKTLTNMAAELKDPKTGRNIGFVNPFPHAALTDALTVLQIASAFDPEVMLARSKEPNVILQSHQPMNQNHIAKEYKFGWKPNLGKRWLKVVKNSDLDFYKTCPIELTIVTDLTPQQVWYD